MYGARPFPNDIIEIDHLTGDNLGVTAADPVIATNLAVGPEGIWFMNGNDLYRISLTFTGVAELVYEDLDLMAPTG